MSLIFFLCDFYPLLKVCRIFSVAPVFSDFMTMCLRMCPLWSIVLGLSNLKTRSLNLEKLFWIALLMISPLWIFFPFYLFVGPVVCVLNCWISPLIFNKNFFLFSKFLSLSYFLRNFLNFILSVLYFLMCFQRVFCSQNISFKKIVYCFSFVITVFSYYLSEEIKNSFLVCLYQHSFLPY